MRWFCFVWAGKGSCCVWTFCPASVPAWAAALITSSYPSLRCGLHALSRLYDELVLCCAFFVKRLAWLQDSCLLLGGCGSAAGNEGPVFPWFIRVGPWFRFLTHPSGWCTRLIIQAECVFPTFIFEGFWVIVFRFWCFWFQRGTGLRIIAGSFYVRPPFGDFLFPSSGFSFTRDVRLHFPKLQFWSS